MKYNDRRTYYLTLILGVFFFTLVGICCTSSPPAPLPRPFGYPRIEFPQDYSYVQFQKETCPYTFNYPDWGELAQFREDSCWVDIYFPLYDCTWHITYRELETKAGIEARNFILEEHRSLIYNHSKKASNILNSPLSESRGYGVFYEIYGNVGTPAQVFFSDSANTQILMTSFYYNSTIQNDSLHPISELMKGELLKMVESIQWN